MSLKTRRRCTLGLAIEGRGQFVLQRRFDSVGSSEKKEKRRRRSPAYGPYQPELIGPDVFLRDPIGRADARDLKDHP
jgi:hypothetical protein